MSIYKILSDKNDSRTNGVDSRFNGYLEDYLSTVAEDELDPVIHEAFAVIRDEDPETKICVGLRTDVNDSAISNQIIRYKDISKLSGKPIVYPYIVYGEKNGQERALIVMPAGKCNYIYAKGLYYCMTEPGSEFIDCKNEIVAVAADSAQKVSDAYASLFKTKAGALQRTLDHDVFKSYEELKAAAMEAAEAQVKECREILPELSDRTSTIYRYVVNWFLLKKVLYVQYMVNKNFLNTIHEGNVRRQRNQAKLHADDIPIVSYSEMWRMQKGSLEAQEEAEAVSVE